MLVAKTTPQVNAQVRALLQDPNRAPDIPGTEAQDPVVGCQRHRHAHRCCREEIDVAQGGVIYRAPTIRTDAGIAALKPSRRATG